MKKPAPKEMSDEQLLQGYVTGSKWLLRKQQVAGTDKDTEGEQYDHKTYMAGLKRLEQIEEEMQKRDLAY